MCADETRDNAEPQPAGEPTRDVGALVEAIRRARDEQQRPPTEEEGVKEIGPVEMYLGDDDMRVLWSTISQVSKHAAETYDKYLDERFLLSEIVQIVSEHDGDLRWDDLIALLEERAEKDGRWLLAVPIANALISGSYHEAGPGVGIRLAVQDKGWALVGDAHEAQLTFAMQRHLDDRINVGVRWQPVHRAHNRVDTRIGPVLVQQIDGVQTMAISLALTRAGYAIAMWTLLKPPEQAELWPSLANWEPRPHRQHDLRYKPYEPGKWTGRASPRVTNTWHRDEYAMPEEPEWLAAPFRAMELAPERVSARAMLSSAWSLHLVERQPNDLQPTDEVLILSNAIDALCDLGEDTSGSFERWERITERYGVWESLHDVHTPEEVEQAKRLARDLRNIATHGGDAVLINLGYPRDLERPVRGKRVLTGADLALARASSSLPIVGHAVRWVLRLLAIELIARDFDDTYFKERFAPVPDGG